MDKIIWVAPIISGVCTVALFGFLLLQRLSLNRAEKKLGTTVKIETVDHDVLVLRFNCVIDKETRDQLTEKIIQQYKTGLIIVPEYMDVYVAKTKKYIAKED